MIAHEINNPLETAQNALYLARYCEDAAEANGYIDVASKELDWITAITRQTLRMNKKSTEPTRVNSTDLLDGLVLIYEDKATRHHVTINADLGEAIDFCCWEGEIRQVLNNLVGNAIDAMPKGGKLTIRVRRVTLWRTGLGLWITKDIVEKHAGRLLLRSSQEGELLGTTFSLLRPLEAESA